MATLFDNGNFRYTAQVQPVRWGSHAGFTLTLWSQWQGAKNPSEQQQRFFACLEREGLERLRTLIDQQLSADSADLAGGAQ